MCIGAQTSSSSSSGSSNCRIRAPLSRQPMLFKREEGGVCVCYAMCVFCFAVGYLTQSVTNIHRQVTLCSIATRQTEEERESENL